MGGKSRFDSWRRRDITVEASSEVPSPVGDTPWNCAERGVVGRGGGWGLPTAQRLPQEETESRLAAPHPALAKRSAASPGRADGAAEPGARGPRRVLGARRPLSPPRGDRWRGDAAPPPHAAGGGAETPRNSPAGLPSPRSGGHKPFYLRRLPGMGTRRGGVGGVGAGPGSRAGLRGGSPRTPTVPDRIARALDRRELASPQLGPLLPGAGGRRRPAITHGPAHPTRGPLSGFFRWGVSMSPQGRGPGPPRHSPRARPSCTAGCTPPRPCGPLQRAPLQALRVAAELPNPPRLRLLSSGAGWMERAERSREGPTVGTGAGTPRVRARGAGHGLAWHGMGGPPISRGTLGEEGAGSGSGREKAEPAPRWAGRGAGPGWGVSGGTAGSAGRQGAEAGQGAEAEHGAPDPHWRR